MSTLKRTALVPYSNRQMYELVNNVEDYPRFLPWCHSSKIIQQSDTEMVALLEIRWKGVHKKLTTRNKLHPYDRIAITLENGPLKHLDGIWQFIALDEKACKIVLDLEFEFAGSLLDRLFQPVFQHIANTFVESFTKRAVELYGV